MADKTQQPLVQDTPQPTPQPTPTPQVQEASPAPIQGQTLQEGGGPNTAPQNAPSETGAEDKNKSRGQLTSVANNIELVIVKADLTGNSKDSTIMVVLEDFTNYDLKHNEGVVVTTEYAEELISFNNSNLYIDDTLQVKLDVVPA